MQADAHHLPFKSGSFDICYHQGFLEHFEDTNPLLSEQYTVLKKRGLLLVDVPQKYSFYTIKKHMLIFLNQWFAGWEKEFSFYELKNLLTDSGFTYVNAQGRYHIRNLDRIQERLLKRRIVPAFMEKAYYSYIQKLENTTFGLLTAFSICMVVSREE